jgi:preprotein translocase subunit YajC
LAFGVCDVVREENVSLETFGILQTLPVLLVLLVLYLAYVRPQWRRANAYKEMLKGLSPGDQVVTVGGLYGQIVAIPGDNDVTIELAPEVQIKARRKSISEVVQKTGSPDVAGPAYAYTGRTIAGSSNESLLQTLVAISSTLCLMVAVSTMSRTHTRTGI